MASKRHLILSAVIAALGGLLFGFDTAVISGTTGALESVYELSKGQLGFTVASALIGTILGSLLAGWPADKYGRRIALVGVAILYFVSAVGSALAWNWYTFMLFRFIGGIGVGASSVIAPMYIAEISPARLRGRLVAVTQFNIVFGIQVAFISNYLISQLDLGALEWRWMFGVEAFPAVIFGFLLLLTPYSPRWLMTRGRIDDARAVLELFGNDPKTVDTEIQDIRASLDLEHHSVSEPLFHATYRKPILLAVAIAMFNQLSGINAVMYYAPQIFTMAGAGEDAALLQTIAVGGILTIVTVLAMLVIDHFGRRRLMLVGSLGYILSLATIGWAFHTYADPWNAVKAAEKLLEKAQESVALSPADPTAIEALAAAQTVFDRANEATGFGGTAVLIGLLVFIASHAFGQGAVIWVFISEIFPNRVRARGLALGCFTHWVMAAAISWTFPIFAEQIGGVIFAIYAGMMVLQLLWVLLKMPETKGVPLEKIQEELGIS